MLASLSPGQQHEVRLPLPTGLTMGALVWLPRSFSAASSASFPTIFFLHGG